MQGQIGGGAVPCNYPALVVRGRPKAALRYSEPSYDATATTTATIDSAWSARHRVIPRRPQHQASLFRDSIITKMIVALVVLALMNAIIAVPLYAGKDDGMAGVGPEPLVCMYQCTENVANEMAPMPDEFCDLVYYQLEERYTFLEWPNSTCMGQLVLTASASKTRKYGITIHSTQGDESSEQLKTSAGVTQFIKLWKNNVRHHGLTFVSGTYGMLNALARFNLNILGRFKSLQVAANSMTGQRGHRRYVLLGIQAWFANFSAEKVALAAVLKKISTSQPVNLLVLYTHIWHWPTTQCIVSGPTILSNNLHVPLPAMDTTMELVNAAGTPKYVTVLLSLSAIVSRFIMDSGWENAAMYGSQCVDREAVPYSNVCGGTNVLNPGIAPEASVAIAHVYTEDGVTLATYETADTIKSKVMKTYV
ncbi:hypothetical protein MTO96_040831 [Rhipicephalus appendiculatus]